MNYSFQSPAAARRSREPERQEPEITVRGAGKVQPCDKPPAILTGLGPGVRLIDKILISLASILFLLTVAAQLWIHFGDR